MFLRNRCKNDQTTKETFKRLPKWAKNLLNLEKKMELVVESERVTHALSVSNVKLQRFSKIET